MSEIENSEAWVAAAVRELTEAKSWTGRIHIHKLFAITELLSFANQPFEFELYYYGPYSRDLDWTIAEMEARGMLERKYPKPGYGPSFRALSSPELDPSNREKVNRVARALRDRDASSLELIATCLWVDRRENLGSDGEIVERVHQIKPRYTRSQIEKNLVEARQVKSELSAA